jgi:hypothetical protein
MENRHLRKRGITAVLACALAAVLLVPAAGAQPGNGNGNGNGNGGGKPAWAGGGGGPNGGGKPEWAGAGKERAEAKKAERQAARDGKAEPGEDAPKHDNPAWICKFERERMGAEAFAEAYGENENKANAFGKCVAREAHDRDGVTEEDEEAPAPEEETDETGDSTDEEPDGTASPASVEAFLHYLWPLLFQL